MHRLGPDSFVAIGGHDGTFQSYPLAPLHAKLLREQSPASVAFYTFVYLAMSCEAFCASKAAAAAAGVCCVGPAMCLRLDPPVMRCAPGLSSCLPCIRLRFGPGSLDLNPPPAAAPLGSEVDHPIASLEDTVDSDLFIVDSEPEADSDSESESERDWHSDSSESEVCDSDTVEDSDSEAVSSESLSSTRSDSQTSESPPRKRKKLS